MLPWKRLIRFEAEDGRIHWGVPDHSDDIGELYHSWRPFGARILRGKGPFDPHAELSVDWHPVRRLLAPLDRKSVKAIRALGANFPVKPGHQRTPIPIVFQKSLNTISGPDDKILLPPAAVNEDVDYECELVVVLGREAKDVSEDEAMQYVAAYCICNDVSSRKRCAQGQQWALGKNFDSWLPLGPCLVNASTIDVNKLELKTEVNGRLCQHGHAKDMLYNIPQTIAHLSAGTTLEAGSIILMGSPPPLEKPDQRRWLKHGDQVKLSITGLGSLYNRVEELNAVKAKL